MSLAAARAAAEPSSSGQVLARFEGVLRRFVERRVSGPDADDVLQEILLRVHLGVGGLRASDRLAPWIYRVARGVIIDHYRRDGARARRVADTLDEEPSDDVLPLLAACVAPFLDTLSSDQAEALRLTDLGGLTQVDAAKRLGVPLPTLKSRVLRGRRQMRTAFDACCALVVDARGKVIEATPRCGCADLSVGVDGR